MEDNLKVSPNLGAALVVWVAAFAASWAIFLLITGTAGLALVFSVFVALVAFDLTRRSLRTGLVIFGTSLFVVILQMTYYFIS